MRCIYLTFTLLLAILASASPFPNDKRVALAKESPYIDFGRRIALGTCGKCDLSKARLPQAPIPLAPPEGKLQHVVVGRGTQNYTCDTADPTAAPAAAGAVATLFNVTCLAAEAPRLVATLSNIALNMPIPYDAPDDANTRGYYGLSGHHWFLDLTTAFFDLDTGKHAYGAGAFRRDSATAAPETAMVGPKNEGHGAIPWLRLKSAQGYGGLQTYSEVYRVRTAGGSPPSTCVGQPARFQIEYATEYWFYS